MGTRRTNAFISLICGVLLSSQVFAGASTGFVEVPRNYGPFTLGMSVAEFTRLTGITPETCPVCLEQETYSSLNSAHIQKFIPDHQNKDGVDFFFLNGELYLISRTPDVRALNVVSDDVTQALGSRGQRETKTNGVSVMKWENESTVVSLNYNAANNEVFSVNIQDWNLSQEKAWRESLLMEQTANLAQ